MLNNCLEWYKWVSTNLYTPQCLTHLFHGRGHSSLTHQQQSFSWSRMTAPVELVTRYTTPDTAVDIGSTNTTVEQRAVSCNGWIWCSACYLPCEMVYRAVSMLIWSLVAVMSPSTRQTFMTMWGSMLNIGWWRLSANLWRSASFFSVFLPLS